jgi:hypothetical protein
MVWACDLKKAGMYSMIMHLVILVYTHMERAHMHAGLEGTLQSCIQLRTLIYSHMRPEMADVRRCTSLSVLPRLLCKYMHGMSQSWIMHDPRFTETFADTTYVTGWLPVLLEDS